MKRNFVFVIAAMTILTGAATAQVGDVGNVVDKKCVNGRVTVGGTGNVVTVTGYCPVAVIKGTGNVLNIDRVGKIDVKGIGNTVQYRYLNPNPQNAKLKIHPGKVGGGVGNTVSWTKGGPFSDNDDGE